MTINYLEAQVRLLERQKASLEQQLQFQQDKTITFDMMIDIAENELNNLNNTRIFEKSFY